MRTYTTMVREGEKIGEIDWGYDFRKHFDTYCTDDAGRDQICAAYVRRLGEIEAKFLTGEKVKVTTSGGWPRFGYAEVVDIGMYDGWPYWKPVPSVMTRNGMGHCEWHCFAMLTDYEAA